MKIKNKKINNKENNKKDNYKNNINLNKVIDKLIIKKILVFFVIACITILYCVLYSKMYGIYTIINVLYFALLVYISVYDIKHKVITNVSNISLFLLGMCYFIFDSFVKYSNQTKMIGILIISKVIICIVSSIILFLIRKVLKDKIGGGDIKMLIALLARFTVNQLFGIISSSIIFSSLYALYLVFVKKKSRTYQFAFGIFISINAVLMMLFN